jgi:hypothetical protein
MVDLLHQLRQAELGEDTIPAITAEKISAQRAGGVRPRLFIDEMDKCTASEFARNSVHRLIDEVYRMAGGDGNGVQLVVCTNLTREELSDTWGAAILRRLEETCFVVDYFDAAQSWRAGIDGLRRAELTPRILSPAAAQATAVGLQLEQ